MSEKPAGRRPTIADVAAAAGVSRTTVSHALSGSGRVDPQTRQRVREAAASVNYRPSARARALRSGRSNVLAVASSMHPAVAGESAHLGFFMEIAAAAAERCFEHGYALVLVPPVSTEPLAAISGTALDGVLVVEPPTGDPVVSRLRADDIPFVTVGRAPDSRPDDCVVELNVEETARIMLGHLADRGCRQPVLVVGDQDRASYRAARQTWAELAGLHGWAVEPVTVDESSGEDGGRRAVAAALEQHPDIDGIAAWVDAFAVGAVSAVVDSGRSVPTDVAVLTRYNGLRARSCEPRLTAVDLSLPQAAAAAVDLLLAQLDAAPGEAPASAVAPAPRLVRRRSTAT